MMKKINLTIFDQNFNALFYFKNKTVHLIISKLKREKKNTTVLIKSQTHLTRSPKHTSLSHSQPWKSILHSIDRAKKHRFATIQAYCDYAGNIV